MATLYELTGEFLELLSLAEDPDVDPEVFADTLEGLEGEIEVKAEGYACVLKELEAEEKKFSAEIDRLTVNRNSIRENMKRMKEHLKETMIVIGKPKFSSEHFKFSVAKNGGLQPLSLAPIDMIPDEYIIMEPKADTDRIRRDLNDGVELSFAHLEERGTHLNIR